MRRAATKALPSQGYLRSRLDYDPLTGVLTWKARGGKKFWNAQWEGRRAGSLPKNARYRTIDIEGVTLLEHRVVWKWVTGSEPRNRSTTSIWNAGIIAGKISEKLTSPPTR